jgi:hypothetical protein
MVDQLGAERGLDVIIPRLGDMIDLSKRKPADKWWEPMITPTNTPIITGQQD